MTEQEAKALAAELDSHRYWRVTRVRFNPQSSVNWGLDLVPVASGATWEVRLEHRAHPGFAWGHLINSRTCPPEQYPQLAQILNRDNELIERMWREWQDARAAQKD